MRPISCSRRRVTVSRRAVLPFLALTCLGAFAPAQSAGFPEGQATIATLLLQYDPEIAGDVFPTWRDLARSLPAEVAIVVACDGSTDQERATLRLLEHAGFARDRIDVVAAEGPPSAWARDRLVALGSASGTVLLTPEPSDVPVDLQPDVAVAGAVADRLVRFSARSSMRRFAGGNLLFTSDLPIAGVPILHANLEHPDGDPTPVLEELAEAFGAAPLVVGRELGTPHEHCDMFLTVVGRRHVLLGDPGAGAALLEELLENDLPPSVLPAHDAWSPEVVRAETAIYEAMREELVAAGFRVGRVPILVGHDGGFLTWNNALVERRDGGVVAYVPVYGVPALDRAALDAYARAGVRTFPIDVSRLAPHGGTVRCVTNVLEWRPAVEPARPR